MRIFCLFCIALLLALAVLADAGLAQGDKTKRLSPPAQAGCKFSDGKTISVDYSSPRMNGRKIYGGVVPYGQEWRAGDNEATTFIADTDMFIGGKTVPAGTYTLFAVPAQSQWTLVISKKTGEWGTPYPGKEFDFARIGMNVKKLPAPVEHFLIAIDRAGPHCTMRMDWETTRASIEIFERK